MSSPSPHRVVVVGSSFAGLTAALDLRKHLDDRHEVVVLDPRDHFTFIPSLIWVPFGLRKADDITFPLEPLYTKKGIRFVNEAAATIDPVAHVVTTASGEAIAYDKLVVATGPRLAFEKVPGLGPEHGYTQSVCNLNHALLAEDAWERFLENPGPVVVGTAQGGSCFGLPNTVITEVRDGEMELEGGRTLPFAYSMIVPPFTGVNAVRDAEGLANPMGFVPVTDEFRHPEHEDVFSAGVAVAIAPPEQTPVPAGVPKTGQMSEVMARAAVHNIVADIQGGKHKPLPITEMAAVCVLDAGNGGIIFKADRVLAPGESGAHVMAGPHAHWAKLAFERYFLGSRKRGLVGV